MLWPCVSLSVHLSVTSRSSVKTAKCRITPGPSHGEVREGHIPGGGTLLGRHFRGMLKIMGQVKVGRFMDEAAH